MGLRRAATSSWYLRIQREENLREIGKKIERQCEEGH